jgi:hypothetical protein
MLQHPANLTYHNDIVILSALEATVKEQQQSHSAKQRQACQEPQKKMPCYSKLLLYLKHPHVPVAPIMQMVWIWMN